jgi:Cu(I)/Ag(I) efflux system membrane protein CusA/SilA
MFWKSWTSKYSNNSPISMIETIILLKPQKEWSEGKTKSDINNEITNFKF